MADTSVFAALVSRADHATAAIDWCEENGAVVPFIQEFYNTLSSLLFCAAGSSIALQASFLPRLRPVLRVVGPLVFLLGAASAAFHATLTLSWQRADEVLENVALAALLHGAAPAPPRALLPLAHGAAAAAGVLRVHALLFTELHLVGTAVWLGLRLRALGGALGRAREAPAARGRAAVVAAAAVAGAAAWLADRAACSALAGPWNPQLHAWWHAAGAVALHEAWACAALATHALDSAPRRGEGRDCSGGGAALRVGAGGLLSVVVARG